MILIEARVTAHNVITVVVMATLQKVVLNGPKAAPSVENATQGDNAQYSMILKEYFA